MIYGCNNFCSYCIVPCVQGGPLVLDEIIREVRSLAGEGYLEIIWARMCPYGHDLGGEVYLREPTDEGRVRICFPRI